MLSPEGGLLPAVEWEWKPSLIGVGSSGATKPPFALEDGTWRTIVSYRRATQVIEHVDYAGDRGKTIRFGDGVFGAIPEQGSVFKVTYRLGGGSEGNLPSGALDELPEPVQGITSVTNPFAVTNGLDEESIEDVRKLAPEAFHDAPPRAVRPVDYARALEEVEWVQRAGATFRWTGSWLSCFATADPSRAVALSDSEVRVLQKRLDARRQAGREVRVLEPRYASIDVRIEICAEPTSYGGDVERAVTEALVGRGPSRFGRGFFSPDNFTFGTPLSRSKLEAAVDGVSGVRAVGKIEVRRRGYFDWQELSESYLPVGDDVVIRLEDDPRHPDWGSLTLDVKGGA
jgi:predicted phage baseplate assembly protein